MNDIIQDRIPGFVAVSNTSKLADSLEYKNSIVTSVTCACRPNQVLSANLESKAAFCQDNICVNMQLYENVITLERRASKPKMALVYPNLPTNRQGILFLLTRSPQIVPCPGPQAAFPIGY